MVSIVCYGLFTFAVKNWGGSLFLLESDFHPFFEVSVCESNANNLLIIFFGVETFIIVCKYVTHKSEKFIGINISSAYALPLYALYSRSSIIFCASDTLIFLTNTITRIVMMSESRSKIVIKWHGLFRYESHSRCSPCQVFQNLSIIRKSCWPYSYVVHNFERDQRKERPTCLAFLQLENGNCDPNFHIK